MRYPARTMLAALSICSTFAMADYSTATKNLNNSEYDKALIELNKLAQAGHSAAQYQLANLYENGLGTEKDLTSAYAWYMIAMDNDYPNAKEKYRSLRREIPSRKEGKDAYKKLSGLYGHKQQQAFYAPVLKESNFYHERAQVLEKHEPEYDNGVKTHTSAWVTLTYNVNESGKVEDARILASFPKSVIDDSALEAINQWKYKPKLTNDGDLTRVYDLIHTFKVQSTSQNHKQYKKQLAEYAGKLRAFAEAGNGYAQARYAMMLEQEVIEPDTINHITWYYRAAINGNNDAQLRLVHCFENGEGCQPDENKAHAWLVRASESGNPRAQFQLANVLQDYDSVHYNIKKAAEVLKLAAHNQYLPAMISYSKVLAFSDEAEIRDAQAAVKYAELARALDPTNPILLSVLGTSYTELGKIQQGEDLLYEAYEQAKHRNWPTESYLQLIEGGKSAMMASEGSPTYK